MDSFYDIPRSAPIPTYVNQISVTPTVPEVSLLCNSSKAPITSYASYNTWRNNQEKLKRNGASSVGEVIHPETRPNCDYPVQFNSPQNAFQFSKKQVRFESPMQQQRPSLTYEPFITRKKSPPPSDNRNIPTSKGLNIESKPVMSNNPFQQMYMANIPNRQLDLSIIDVPTIPRQPQQFEEKEISERSGNLTGNQVHINSMNNDKICKSGEENKENKLPKTYKDFLGMQKSVPKNMKPNLNDSVTDIFNYKRRCTNPDEMKHEQVPGKLINDSGSGKLCSVPLRLPDMLPTYRQSETFNDNDSDLYRNDIRTVSNPISIVQNYNDYVFQKQSPLSPADLQSSKTPIKSCEGSTQTSVIFSPSKSTETAVQTKHESEPSTKDLLKIIAQQNEQLMLLQRQVATLLSRDQKHNRPLEDAQKINYMGERCVTSTQNEHFKHENICTPRKRAGMSKFSIDLMTSFEVAIRPQPKSNFVNCEPKIQEITESESLASNKYSDKQVDQSLQLKEPVKIQEACPSPEPSININMNDYDSSSDDEISVSEIGATFYNNLMGQVNNILKKAQMQTKEDLLYKQEHKAGANPGKKTRTLNKVKEATLKHLKSIGVNIDDTEATNSSVGYEDDGKGYSPSEISFAVKQLLMKYLPDDELARIQANQVKPAPLDKEQGFISPRPDFSLASVQYMQKYNLIPSNETKRGMNRFGQTPAQHIQQAQVDNPKILDMTALKMQPKLL